MNIRNFFAYLCLTVALFSIAGMRKNEDPIAATAQTSPISLKQKLEETKDGVKGAPSPSMTFYGSQPVLTGSPVKEEGKDDFVEEEEPSAPQEEKLFEEDDSWEVDSELTSEIGQESPEKAVENEDSWWSEDEASILPEDTQSESEF